MNTNPTVAELAKELGLPLVTVQRAVSDLAVQYGGTRIVAAGASMRTSTLTPFAVVLISASLAVTQ